VAIVCSGRWTIYGQSISIAATENIARKMLPVMQKNSVAVCLEIVSEGAEVCWEAGGQHFESFP
jgi:hypothetical protein